MIETTIQTWKELADLAEQFTMGTTTTIRENWIFRGVENKTHDLTPKVGRPGTWRKWPTGDPGEYDPDIEHTAVARFKREVSPHLNLQPASALEWLSVAQHHGMPTRLLDWTESVFVAAYFALKAGGIVVIDGKTQRQDAAIYGIPCPTICDDPDRTTEDVIAIVPRHLSSRITAQRGLFTWHRKPTKPYDSPQLRKWIIPSNECFKLKVILSKAGFNEASTFPDIDGIAKHIGWLMKWSLI